MAAAGDGDGLADELADGLGVGLGLNEPLGEPLDEGTGVGEPAPEGSVPGEPVGVEDPDGLGSIDPERGEAVTLGVGDGLSPGSGRRSMPLRSTPIANESCSCDPSPTRRQGRALACQTVSMLIGPWKSEERVEAVLP